MRWYAILVVAVTSLLFACGGGNDETAIREAVEEFIEAFANDPPKAYTFLAQDCKEQVRFPEFAAGRFFFEGLLGERDPEVRDFEIISREGDEIVAQFEIVLDVDGEEISLSTEDDGPTRFVNEDGQWRLAECETLWPIGGFREAEEETATASRFDDAPDVEADDDPTLPGEFVDLPQIYGGPYPDTASHVRRDIDYVADGNSNPPAGGPHWGSGACTEDPDTSPPFCGPAPWGIYRKPWMPESLVHNMEHGGVVLWYNTTAQEIIDELEDLIVDRLNDGQILVMAPYPDMEEETIALTAWSRIDKFPIGEYSRERVEQFIDAHERRFNPEAF